MHSKTDAKVEAPRTHDSIEMQSEDFVARLAAMPTGPAKTFLTCLVFEMSDKLCSAAAAKNKIKRFKHMSPDEQQAYSVKIFTQNMMRNPSIGSAITRFCS